MATYKLPPAQFRSTRELRAYYKKMRNVLATQATEVMNHAGEVEMALATIRPAKGPLGRWQMRRRAKRVSRHTERAAAAIAAAAAAQVRAYQVYLSEFAPELAPKRRPTKQRFEVRS